MELIITDNITREDEAEIYEALKSYNLSKLEVKEWQDLGIYVEDTDGKKQAGLIGDTWGVWLNVKYLWVDGSLRGQHIGTKLLGEAERVAKERGCKYVFLDTFSFQAPDFYKRRGYKEVFVLDEYPKTGKRYYLTKEL